MRCKIVYKGNSQRLKLCRYRDQQECGMLLDTYQKISEQEEPPEKLKDCLEASNSSLINRRSLLAPCQQKALAAALQQQPMGSVSLA